MMDSDRSFSRYVHVKRLLVSVVERLWLVEDLRSLMLRPLLRLSIFVPSWWKIPVRCAPMKSMNVCAAQGTVLKRRPNRATSTSPKMKEVSAFAVVGGAAAHDFQLLRH